MATIKSSHYNKEIQEDDVLRSLPHAPGCEKSTLSSIMQDPVKFLRLAKNENIVSSDFHLPAHALLYGFFLKMENEGKDIELVSLIQGLLDHGLLEKCGGPAGVSGIFSYSVTNEHFQTHLQEVKNKAVLRDIINNARSTIESAYDAPSEVKELIEDSTKKLSSVIEKTENRASDFRRYRQQLMTAEEMHDTTIAYLNGDRLLGGDGFFLPDFELAFRKHECTVWLGISHHGKSQAVQNQVANLAARGRRSMIASFEQPAPVTLGQILNAMTAYPGLVRSEYFERAYAYLNSVVTFYRGQTRTNPKHLIDTFRQAYLNDGTDNFFIDNLMTMNVDRGDNSALAAAIDLMRMFVADYPVHLHLVTHPRKPPDELSTKPPTQNSIRGPAEIGDMPQNVMVVWRDSAKGEKLAEMKASNFPEAEQLAFYNGTPCGKFLCRKQRTTGETPVINCWFNKETNRFMTQPGKPKPMFSTPPWD